MGSRAQDPGTRWAHRVGLSVGLILVVGALYAWRVPPGPSAPLGTDVVLTVAPTGELAVSPIGPFLKGTDLRPGGKQATGTLKVRNQTGTTLTVELRAHPNLDDLDHVLQLEITAKQAVLFRGDLGGLRHGVDPLTIRRGRTQSLSFRAWIPAQASTGSEGDVASVGIELLSEPEED